MSDRAGVVEGGSLGQGRYVLQRLLGEGGMASVQLAHDSVLDRRVAVKILHTELGREASFKERFRREAQAVARLQHANIVSVFDTGEDLGADGVSTPYIVMEFVEGKVLRDVLNESIAHQGAMPTAQALKITAEVLSALEEAHDQGLVHRDIKPGNVMVSAKGVAKVMDFGIARALQSGVTSMTQTGMVVGTPQYLSPEQALGRSVDARSDLYSVGCMLFELLTGRLPFDGESAFSIAYKHVQEEPPTASTINRALPPAVDALIARALRKDPAHRFPTAAAMRDEIERISAGGGGKHAAAPVISDGPWSVPAAQPLANFPQVGGEFNTPQPQVLQPYQPSSQAPPYPRQGPSTPAPYPRQGPSTPAPYPQAPYAQSYPRQQAYPQAYAGPGQPSSAAYPQSRPPVQQRPPMPSPYGAPSAGGSGCSTAMIVIGVLVGVLVLAVVIVLISAAKGEQKRRHAALQPVVVVQQEPSRQGV